MGLGGSAVDAEDLAGLERLRDDLEDRLGDVLSELLSRREVARDQQRVARRLREGAFPLPGDGWPSLPWPAF